MVADGVGDESDSDPSLATKFQMADGVERSKYTMSGCMPDLGYFLSSRDDFTPALSPSYTE